MNFNLPKEERLNNKTLIESLFEHGDKIYKSGFICFWYKCNLNNNFYNDINQNNVSNTNVKEDINLNNVGDTNVKEDINLNNVDITNNKKDITLNNVSNTNVKKDINLNNVDITNNNKDINLNNVGDTNVKEDINLNNVDIANNKKDIICKNYDNKGKRAHKGNSSNSNVFVMFSVSKKHHKLSVNRNKIKRLLKESYRLNKKLVHNYVNSNERLLMCFIYTKKNIPLYSKTNEVMIDFLNEIANKLKENNNE